MFKGIATAHLDYDDPSQRHFFDADLLVPRPDLPRAIDVLSAAGFGRDGPSISRRWEHRFARAVELRFRDGVELDLHASLATGYFGWTLDHDLLRLDRKEIDLGGIECSAFGPMGRFLISCYAVVLSRGPSLRLQRDLAQQLFITEADWRSAAAIAGEGAAVSAEALRRLDARTRVAHPAFVWAVEFSESPTASSALRLAEQAETEGWAAMLAARCSRSGVADRVRFIGPVLARRLRRS